MTLSSTLRSLLLATAAVTPLAAATPPIVLREEQRLSVSGLPADIAPKGFGGQLKVSGDTAIVLGGGIGEDAWESGVYIYVFQNGAWTFQQRILGTEVGEFSEFGHAIALDGDTLAISASAEPKGAIQNAGCVLVYVRSNGVWTLQTKLFADDAAAGNFLGDGIVIDGDTLMTLAHGDINNSGNNAGNVYFFHRTNGVWTQQGDLPTSTAMRDKSPYEEHPLNIALHGDLAFVGAPFDTITGQDAAGRVFLFRRTNGTWASDGTLIQPGLGNAYDFFGTSIATDGETLLVSAPESGGLGIGEGKVLVYERGQSSWELRQTLRDGTPDLLDPTMKFGATLELAGDTALIGGPSAGIDGLGSQAGCAFIFRRMEGTWTLMRRLLPDGTDNGGTAFGTAMALDSRDRMLIVNKEENGQPSFDPTMNNRGVVVCHSLVVPEGMPLRVLALAETSGDEVLSPTEWNALFPVDRVTSVVFGYVDWNKSGSIDYLELLDGLESPTMHPAYLLWMAYLELSAELDVNGDFQLSRDELLHMYQPGKPGANQTDAFIKRLKLPAPAPLTTAQWFRGKGLPTLAAYDAAIATRAQRLALAGQLDVDDDSFVSRQEFSALFPPKVAAGKIDAAWRSATGTPKKIIPPVQIGYGAFVEAPVLPKVKAK